MEGIIDYGYITLFAAAFPIGPAIAMVVSVPEIRMKVYSFLYVYKRPNCDRCSGIGEWLNIIELMSLFGVFSNFTLLYFKHKQSTLNVYQSNKQVKESKDLQIWFFILSIVILMLVKTFFKEIIPDRPVWVS
jgi:Calcium-activated chloride channel